MVTDDNYYYNTINTLNLTELSHWQINKVGRPEFLAQLWKWQ